MSSHHILVVEDDPLIQGFAKVVLESAGFDVEMVGTAKEALESFRARKPDMVIIDIGLPDGNGQDVIRDMGLGVGSDIPFIYLTGRGDLKVRLDAFNSGAQDYIQKPFAVEELLARVKVHLKIKKSHDDLAQRNYDLELMNRARQDMTDMIVHDLKSPLTSIMGTLDIIRGRGLISNEDHRKLLEHAGTAADFMLLMLNDLLDIGQAEHATLKTDLADFSAQILLTKLEVLFASRVKIFGVDFEPSLAPDVRTIRSDHNLVFRILVNLITNAIKASQRGSQVELECSRAAKDYRFVVSDRGAGVPNAEKARIFEKYTTMGVKAIGADGGTGIGLAFCRLATTALKGRVWVEDRPGGGSRFILELPAP